jgi:uncharacterized protein (TIGR00369 family)
VAVAGRYPAAVPDRSITTTWGDQELLAEAGRALTGLEHVLRTVDGRLPRPSMLELLGIEVREVEEGRVVTVVTPGEQHYNLIGVVHGGLVATLVDTAMGLAFQTCAALGERCATLNLDVTMIAPLRGTTGEIRAEGRVFHRGGRALAAQATVVDPGGTLVATGNATAIRMRMPPPPTAG